MEANRYEQADSHGRYKYEFAESDRVHFAIAITDEKVSGLGLYSIGKRYLKKINGVGLASNNLKTNWYFKCGLTLGEKAETVDKLFGMPSWPQNGNVDDTKFGMFEDHTIAHTSIYAFNDDYSCLTFDEYETNKNGDNTYSPTCYAYLSYLNGKLQSLMIRYGGDPKDMVQNQYYDNLVGTP